MSAEPLTEPRLYDVEEFFALVPDGQKADLIDGVIYMASPDTPRNADITSFLHFLLRGFSRTGNRGKVYSNRVAFVLAPRRCPEPDVAFISSERLSAIQETRVQGGPDIAVEITAKESTERDYITKRALYEEAGVREYWIVDPLQQRCTFLLLENGRYTEAPLRGGLYFHSAVLPGFWLDTRWLLGYPLPDEFECLDLILAGPPPR
jgi:Uma2 family endonuclease